MYGINLITIETDIANEITGIGNELFLGEDRAALTGVAMIAFRAEIEKYPGWLAYRYPRHDASVCRLDRAAAIRLLRSCSTKRCVPRRSRSTAWRSTS